MLWLLSCPPGFTYWISFALVFTFIYCWVLIFALYPFYILIFMSLEMMHWWVRGPICKPNISASWSTSELSVRLAPWNQFNPQVKYFYRPFQGGTSVDHSCCFCFVFVMRFCASVYWWLVVTCWERADFLALVCDVLLWVCTFPVVTCGTCTWLYRFLIFALFLTFVH